MTSLTLRSVDIRPTEAAVWTLLLANPQLTELHCDLPAGAGLQQQVQLQRQSLQARRRWLEQFLVELSLSRRKVHATEHELPWSNCLTTKSKDSLAGDEGRDLRHPGGSRRAGTLVGSLQELPAAAPLSVCLGDRRSLSETDLSSANLVSASDCEERCRDYWAYDCAFICKHLKEA